MSQAPIDLGPPPARDPRGAAYRQVISDSWHRVRRQGVDPEGGGRTRPLTADEVEIRRRESPLTGLLPALREGLDQVAGADRHIMLVTDADGRVLWREGNLSGRRAAERLNITEGVSWAEEVAGTNAIGTALVTRGPVQVTATEHYVHSHRIWTCSAAPLHDPRDGRLLGVVDVSGPAAAQHPAVLSLVSAVARVAEGELRTRHWAAVEGLRSLAAPLLFRLSGQALVVDPHGWTAAVTGMPPVDRIALPVRPQAGTAWLPALGTCRLEPLPGGWLVRVGEAEQPPGPAQVLLDVSRARSWTLTVSGPAGGWSQELSPRHAELLYVLAVHRGGRTAAQLARDLFGDPGRAVTVRAELSRLRRTLRGVLAHRPYRFADAIDVRLLPPPRPADLLPHSAAPAVRAARGEDVG